MLVSVIITTYNRREALLESLGALGRQTMPPDQYEVLVVDDGSTDCSYEAASDFRLACRLRTFRNDGNRGISASRNTAIREAAGEYLIFVSDDLIVPPEFLATHVETLRMFPGYWVVGGIRQLPSISESSFGRYLDSAELSWEEARKATPLAPEIWEMHWPTARNLSLPRADLDRTGLFDEQFRMSCEDQDLAHEARRCGIRFLYNARITCLHNDQVGDLRRFCRAQVPRTHDTALFCAKRPEHARSPLELLNGPIGPEDRWLVSAKKVAKQILSRPIALRGLERLTVVAERLRCPDVVTWRLYRVLVGLYMFLGWRSGLLTLANRRRATESLT